MRGPNISFASLAAGAGVGLMVGMLANGPAATADDHESASPSKRVGMVISLKPDQIDTYKKLHANAHPGVRDLLAQANMRNFSIFMRQLDDGRPYLFGYYEYVGTDFEADMAWLAAQPRNQAWLKVTDAMQTPLAGESGWASMEEVYHND